MENKKVMVISNTVGSVSINVPSLHFRRIWERMGAKKPVDLDVLKEIIYDPGVEKMFRLGILYIEDMDVKKELELEPQDAKAPVNIVMLSEAEKINLLKDANFDAFKKKCANLSQQELENLVDFAIDRELVNMDKCRFLKLKTGRDIVKTIENNKEE